MSDIETPAFKHILDAERFCHVSEEPTRDRRKKAGPQAFRCSRGGLITKIHAAVIDERLAHRIKEGNQRALAIIGAGEKAEMLIHGLKIEPRNTLDDRITLSFCLKSTPKTFAISPLRTP